MFCRKRNGKLHSHLVETKCLTFHPKVVLIFGLQCCQLPSILIFHISIFEKGSLGIELKEVWHLAFSCPLICEPGCFFPASWLGFIMRTAHRAAKFGLELRRTETWSLRGGRQIDPDCWTLRGYIPLLLLLVKMSVLPITIYGQ